MKIILKRTFHPDAFVIRWDSKTNMVRFTDRKGIEWIEGEDYDISDKEDLKKTELTFPDGSSTFWVNE